MYHQYARTHSSHTVCSCPIWRCTFLISLVDLTTVNVIKFCSTKYGKWKAWCMSNLIGGGLLSSRSPGFYAPFFFRALQRSFKWIHENGNKRKTFDNNQQPKCKSTFRIMHKDYGLLISYRIDSRKAISLKMKRISIESHRNESKWAKEIEEEHFFFSSWSRWFVCETMT